MMSRACELFVEFCFHLQTLHHRSRESRRNGALNEVTSDSRALTDFRIWSAPEIGKLNFRNAIKTL